MPDEQRRDRGIQSVPGAGALETVLLLLLAAGGIVAAVFSFRLGLNDSGGPGSGLMPFMAGVVMSACATGRLIAQRARASRRVRVAGNRHDAHSPVDPTIGDLAGLPLWPEPGSARRAALVSATLVAMTVALPYAGFLPTSFVTLAVLFRFHDRGRWGSALFLAAAFAAGAWLLFGLWLGVPLPSGAMGM